MPHVPDPFQHEVTRIALAAGQALSAHGLGAPPTEDIDLFTDTEGGVTAASELVRDALCDAGLQVESMSDPSELDEVFYGFDQDMVEFEVHRDAQAVRFDRFSTPVVLDIGPVLHLDDVVGTKVAAMITRAQPRDYIDVAAVLDRYDRQNLIALARNADPDITDDEIHDAIRRLDGLPDTVFALYRLTPAQINEVRAAFNDWA
jgi:hypothetical protein